MATKKKAVKKVVGKKAPAKKTTAKITTAKKSTAKKTTAKKTTAKKTVAKATPGAGMPTVGQKAPAFSLPTDAGKTVKLGDFAGKKNIVLYFYPKADTPGCTTQACAFQKDSVRIDAEDAVVIGVSPDLAPALAKFRSKYSLAFPLASDAGAALAKTYGVWVEKNLYGRKYMGIQRATFLIGKDGRIAAAWPKVKVDGHSAEVLAALKAL